MSHRFSIRSTANSMQLRAKMNSGLCEKLVSLDFRTALGYTEKFYMLEITIFYVCLNWHKNIILRVVSTTAETAYMPWKNCRSDGEKYLRGDTTLLNATRQFFCFYFFSSLELAELLKRFVIFKLLWRYRLLNGTDSLLCNSKVKHKSFFLFDHAFQLRRQHGVQTDLSIENINWLSKVVIF